jgi:hypothetical protein
VIETKSHNHDYCDTGKEQKTIPCVCTLLCGKSPIFLGLGSCRFCTGRLLRGRNIGPYPFLGFDASFLFFVDSATFLRRRLIGPPRPTEPTILRSRSTEVELALSDSLVTYGSTGP